jgi:hypothetical protein
MRMTFPRLSEAGHRTRDRSEGARRKRWVIRPEAAWCRWRHCTVTKSGAPDIPNPPADAAQIRWRPGAEAAVLRRDRLGGACHGRLGGAAGGVLDRPRKPCTLPAPLHGGVGRTVVRRRTEEDFGRGRGEQQDPWLAGVSGGFGRITGVGLERTSVPPARDVVRRTTDRRLRACGFGLREASVLRSSHVLTRLP